MLCLGAPRLEAGDLQELDVQGFASRFKVTSKLGQGGFADVLCVRDASSSELAALKVLSSTAHMLRDVDSYSQAPPQAPEVALFREARVLKHAQHPSVVQLHSVVHIPSACLAVNGGSRGKQDKAGNCWGLLLELLQGGSLQKQVYKAMVQPHIGAYSYLDALTWATDIAAAVAHLHSLNPIIIHRDLKLENVLLKPPAAGSAAANGRKLPLAKLTDFGLHVMIDRPPCPFFLTTDDDGNLLLILGTEDQQQQQQQQQDGAQQLTLTSELQQQQPSTMQKQVLQNAVAITEAAGGGGGGGTPEDLTASTGFTPDSHDTGEPDAEARIAPARSSSGGSAASKPGPASALKGMRVGQQQEHQQPQQQRLSQVSQKPKHVAFADDVSSAAAAPDAAAAADSLAAGDTGDKDKPHTALQQQQQQRQQPQLRQVSPVSETVQWTRLTAGTLRRLSMDSLSSSKSASGVTQQRQGSGVSQNPSVTSPSGRRNSLEQCAAIPLMFQPASSCLGQSGSFVRAAVPADALMTPGSATVPAAAAAAAVSAAVLKPQMATEQSSSSSSSGDSGGPEVPVVRCGVGRGPSFSRILAAANTQRDYEVNLKPAVLKAQQLQRRSPGVSSTNNGSIAHTPMGTPTFAAAAAAVGTGTLGTGDWPPTPRGSAASTAPGAASVSGASVRSGDWPTAASVMWEDLMDDDVDQEQLLGGVGAPAVGTGHGSLVQLPLSYNLTGHTGSFMAMAPEVYKGKPYNESVDVFSMGVMFYELFSRSLLLYTHTPANSAADCEKYAAQIAEGYRPKRPKSIPLDVWDIIEACWRQDPAERLASSEVLHRLKLVLQQAQEEAAAAKGLSRSSRLGMLLRRSDPGPSSTNPGNTATKSEQQLASQLRNAGDHAAAGTVPQGYKASHGQAGAAAANAPPKPPACGCIIC